MDYGEKIILTEKEKIERAKNLLDVSNLRKDIQYHIDKNEEEIKTCLENLESSERIEALKESNEVYRSLLCFDIKCKMDFDTVKWIFNNGNLRNNVDIHRKMAELNELKMLERRFNAEQDPMYIKRLNKWHFFPLKFPFICGLIFSLIFQFKNIFTPDELSDIPLTLFSILIIAVMAGA